MKINSPTSFAGILVLFIACFCSQTSVSLAQASDNNVFSVIGTKQAKINAPSSTSGNRMFNPASGELDSTFNSVVDTSPGNVRAAIVQADGKVIVGGYFKTLNGTVRRSIARLNANNSIDPTFTAEINGTVFAAALEPGGKIIVAGDFTTVGGVSRNRIARLNNDGSLDATFNPGGGADNIVYDVLVQPDGKILLGGSFYGVNSTGSYLVARLNGDGSFDASFRSPFTPPFPSPTALPTAVYSIALQSNGKIILGGTPTLTGGAGGPTFSFTAVTRLNADGSIDSSFNAASINSTVEKLVVQPDDKIIIGGSFSTIAGTSRRFVARLNADGKLDETFNPGTGGNLPVHSIFLKTDGKILIGGDFSTFNGTTRSQIAQLNADGSLDGSFVPSNGLLGTVQTIVSLPNGKALAAGSFQVIFSGTRNSIVILNADGSLDSSAVFASTATGGVRAIAAQADGSIAVGGNFNRINGAQRQNFARFGANGLLLGDTQTGFFISSSGNGQVNSIVVQPDGKLLVGGLNVPVTTSTGGSTMTVIGSIFRFNADGSPDNSFMAGNIPTRRGINAIALQPDGKIIVVWGYNLTNGFPAGGIARLNADGSLDSSFSAGISDLYLNSVVIQPDGKILIGGQFSFSIVNSQTGSVSFNGAMRLNADGSRDTTFVPATISDATRFTNVYALALQTDGKILLGGNIYTAGRTTPTGVARFNADGSLDATFDSGAITGASSDARVEDILPLSNGRVIIGGSFNSIGGVAKNNIARLNSNGALDSSFNAQTDNVVFDVALEADGKILIGGDFETVNGIARTSIARLLNEPNATRRPLFDYDGDGRADESVFRPSNGVWYLNQSTAGYAGYQFGIATDKIVPADYDGDGKTDVAVYRDGNWFVLKSSNLSFASFSFGLSSDIPTPADYDGDGKAELAVYRSSDSTYYQLNTTTSAFTATGFGQAGDVPVVGDYDGDGKSDVAVYRPSNGVWYLNRSRDGYTGYQFGNGTDKLVPADYDGDGKTDVAVYRASEGNWFILNSNGLRFSAQNFGLSTDTPAPADFDGDGKTDLAVYRNETNGNGNWYELRTTQGFTAVLFGASGDKPTPNAFVR